MIEARTFWSRFSRGLVDAVYPRRCALCGELGDSAICEVCQSEMQPNSPEIERATGLSYRYAVYRYEGRASQAVLRLKYARSTALAEPMARLMKSAADELGLLADPVIVPVPIHWTRRARRGFNQAELLCSGLPARLDLLRRVRPTRSQAGLSVAQRQRNLEGAFEASPRVQGLDVLLVDDVVTTGQTGEACAKVLLARGAREVGILAFAGNPVDRFGL